MSGGAVSFLIPRSPTWDKLCALYLEVRAHTGEQVVWDVRPLTESGRIRIVFEDEPDIPPDVVDVDVRQKYNRDGRYGSATQRTVQRHGIDLPGMAHLVEVLNDNNRSGKLKDQPMSLVKLIRDLNNVGARTPSIAERLKVVVWLWPAVQAFFSAAEIDEALVVHMPHPFTLPYVRDLMALAGWEPAGQWVGMIEGRFDRVERRQAAAAGDINHVMLSADSFEVPLYRSPAEQGVEGPASAVAHWIESDNTRLAAEYWQHPRAGVLLVVRRRTGHVAVFCRGQQDFTKLYDVLNRGEPGRWYLQSREGRSPMLLNGSTSRAAQRTGIDKRILIDMIRENYCHRPRRHQLGE